MNCQLRKDSTCIKEECKLYDAENWTHSRCGWNKIKAEAMKLLPVKYFLDEIYRI